MTGLPVAVAAAVAVAVARNLRNEQ
jgi:hypothetical protein